MTLSQPRPLPRLAKPPRIEPGDTVALIAPASPPLSKNVIPDAAALFRRAGFKVEVGSSARKRNGFLAGSDRERLRDLNSALGSRTVRAIVCLRGGHGTTRILDHVDFAALKKHPKILVGCSDITALLCGALLDGGVCAFHGPMPQSLVRSDSPRFTFQHLIDAITGGPLSSGSILNGCGQAPGTVEALRRGRVTGQLVGGNLSLLSALIGTRFFPSLKGKILFLEEIGESPFRLDRQLTHLISIGALDGVAGFALGQFINCEFKPDDAKGKQTSRDVLIERLAGFKKPIVMGLPFGHGPINATIPLGAKATLDGTRGDLIIEAPSVR